MAIRSTSTRPLVEHRLDRCERRDAEPRQHLYNGGAWHARSYRRHRQCDRDAERCWSDAECRTGTALGTLTLVSGGTIRTAPLRSRVRRGVCRRHAVRGDLRRHDEPVDNNAYVYVANGLTTAGVGGSGAGTINLTGQGNELFAAGTETLKMRPSTSATIVRTTLQLRYQRCCGSDAWSDSDDRSDR